jgi:beta-lactam-binding protein with PASTA domain
VVSQTPAAGQLVRPGTPVTLVYAALPPADIDRGRTPGRDPGLTRPQCTVPDLRGMTVAQASRALKNAGLALGDHPRDTKLVVRWQSLEPRSAAACGARVNVGAEVIG